MACGCFEPTAPSYNASIDIEADGEIDARSRCMRQRCPVEYSQYFAGTQFIHLEQDSGNLVKAVRPTGNYVMLSKMVKRWSNR